MLRFTRLFLAAPLRLRGYEPQPVTPWRIWKWLAQFPWSLRPGLLELLARTTLLRKEVVRTGLAQLNSKVLEDLQADGISIQNVIYVSIDSAGSSSGVMLNLLRNAANLEKLSAGLVDSRDTELLRELTSSLGTGALVYVDDFTGTGKQFLRNRRNAAEYLIGSFSEFFLVACACSEAEEKIQREGVVCRSIIAHKRSERPLHERSNLLPQETKSSLQAECFKIHPKEGLGFKKLATNVVLYGNAPNTTPLLLRGSLQQKPRLGVLPRFDELPFPEEVQLDIGE